MVTDMISPMLLWIYMILIKEKEESLSNIIMKSIGFSIVLFGSLIYNEIIICNFFGFNKDTKKSIEERQREELIALNNDQSITETSEASYYSDNIKDENNNIKNNNEQN